MSARKASVLCCAAALICASRASADPQAWSAEKANAWYAKQRWLVGSNYIPADAINQLEMWQEDTFNPAQIDKELGWAEATGMNTMRVFLHDKPWAHDPLGFKRRVDQFLSIAAKHKMKTLLVLFDSCWDPDPKLGRQRAPTPGVHNSGWVQSPGRAALADTAHYLELKAYVQGVIGAFAQDDRILGWDVWNEPDNVAGSAGSESTPAGRAQLAAVTTLLPQVFAWAREVRPTQPLTSGVWRPANQSAKGVLNALEKLQLEQSDFITFHVYDRPEVLERRIKQLQAYGKPIICTEYLARGVGSTFDTSLPIARKHAVGMINWGLVVGKTQTNLPWDSSQRPDVQAQPAIWHHDIFQADGKPYRQAEIDQIRELTSRAQKDFDKTRRRVSR